jgi:hypothetical protein
MPQKSQRRPPVRSRFSAGSPSRARCHCRRGSPACWPRPSICSSPGRWDSGLLRPARVCSGLCWRLPRITPSGSFSLEAARCSRCWPIRVERPLLHLRPRTSRQHLRVSIAGRFPQDDQAGEGIGTSPVARADQRGRHSWSEQDGRQKTEEGSTSSSFSSGLVFPFFVSAFRLPPSVFPMGLRW